VPPGKVRFSNSRSEIHEGSVGKNGVPPPTAVGRDLASTLARSVIGLVLLVIIVPICGALSDRIGSRKIFPIVGAIGMIVLFYPLLMLLNQPGFFVYVVVSASGWVVLGIWQSVYPTI
jgi:nitrate/nitrite transporter NarK